MIDLVLRGASGIDLLVELKQQHPELAAVMMSGLFYTGSMRRAYRAGALDCFEKPFRWTNLLDSLEHGAAIESGRDGRVEVPTFEQLKIDYYRRVIEACDGNLTQAAKFAGLHRTTLQRIVHKRPGTRGG